MRGGRGADVQGARASLYVQQWLREDPDHRGSSPWQQTHQTSCNDTPLVRTRYAHSAKFYTRVKSSTLLLHVHSRSHNVETPSWWMQDVDGVDWVKDRCCVFTVCVCVLCVCVCVGSSSDDRAGCSFLCSREVVQGEEIWPVAKPGGVSVNPVICHRENHHPHYHNRSIHVCLYHILYT